MGLHFQTVSTTNPLFRLLEYPGKNFGGAGVDLFFVLSGFLVGGLLMKEYKRTDALDVPRFIIRRGMKIWPAYYLFIFLEVATHAHPLRSFLWQNLLHVQNYAGSTILHSWSLAVEEHFYLALALGMGWMVSRRWKPDKMLKTLIVLLAVVAFVRTTCYFLFGAEAAFEQTHNRIDSLACGVILALAFNFYPDQFAALSKQRTLLTLTASLVVLFMCTCKATIIRNTIGFTILYIGAASFLLLVYSNSENFRHRLAYRVVATIGVNSYGIYLYHNSIRSACFSLAKHAPDNLQWPVLMLSQYSAAILLGVAMTRLVEWPILRYRDRLLPQSVADIGSIQPGQIKTQKALAATA